MAELEERPEVTLPTSVLHNEDFKVCGVVVGESRLIDVIFSVFLNAMLCVLGLAANIVNITIFVKQGFANSGNISLCALSISDVGALLPLLWRSICLNPLFSYSNIAFDSTDMRSLITGWPHSIFVLITSWITAFIAFERCVCIALPMKVKETYTPKCTFFLTALIFIFTSATICPIFVAFDFSPSTNTARNKTLYHISYTPNGIEIENIIFNNYIFEQLSSFIIVVVCTFILVYKLLSVSNWRQNSSVHSSHHLSISFRDLRVIKMVTFISCVFIFCYLPGAVNKMVSLALSPEYRINGRLASVHQVSWSIVAFVEAFNCSFNIVIYYNMSSTFRSTFNELMSNISSFKQ